MGISFFTNPPCTMVAAQVYLALCVAGVAVAAPQLDFGGLRSVSTTREVTTSNVDEAQVVSSVVSALQPSIAQAVADALAGLRTTSITSTSSKSSLAAANAAAAQKAAVASTDVGPVAKAEYNFEYKVADNDAQTYISQSENRDGDSLTGTYSYVNPDGALITVNYEAGPMGYSQTLEQQDGFVAIKPQPAKASVATSSGSSVTSSSSGSRFSGATSTASNTGFSSSSSSSVDQSALIAQIISALQPQISSAVQSAISSSTTSSTFVAAQPVAVAAPPRARLAALPAPTGGVATTFGDGFSVKIDTPEFNIEY